MKSDDDSVTIIYPPNGNLAQVTRRQWESIYKAKGWLIDGSDSPEPAFHSAASLPSGVAEPAEGPNPPTIPDDD